MTKTNFSTIILAAGKGTRMKTTLPKMLHKIANLEMLNHVLNTSKMLSSVETIVVVSEENKEQLKKAAKLDNITYTIQKELSGTGTAVKAGVKALTKDTEYTLIMYSDECLILDTTYQNLIDKTIENNVDINVLGFYTRDIKNKYGRLITSTDNELFAIVEYKDGTDEQRNITLCNSGIMFLRTKYLKELLEKVQPSKVSGEYYLTDIIKLAMEKDLKCSYAVSDEDEVMGVNSQEELSIAEKIMQKRLVKKFMTNGVTFINPDSVYLSYDTEIGNGTLISPNVFFDLNVKVGSYVKIDPFVYLKNCNIEDNTYIESFKKI